MNKIFELQTGQVSFISGLMAGFSLSIAAQKSSSEIAAARLARTAEQAQLASG